MRAVILDGHTLGVVMGNGIQVLRASVLRGSHHPSMGVIAIPMDVSRMRTATEQDFNDFGVMWHLDYSAQSYN